MNVSAGQQRQLLLLGVLLGFMLANLVQFPAIEADTSPHWRAAHRYGSGDLTTIALDLDSAGNVPDHFGVTLSIGRIARGVEFVAPESFRLQRTLGERELFGLARVDRITLIDYDPHNLLSHTGTLVARGEGGSSGEPFSIVVDDREGTIERFVLFVLEPDTEFVVIDARLLDPTHPAAP